MADLLLEITAPSWPALVVEATLALAEQLGAIDQAKPTAIRRLAIDGIDREELLVRWLTNTIVWTEIDGLLVGGVEISVASEQALVGAVTIAPAASLTGAVKAVTYHDLKIVRDKSGWRVRILFDL